MPTYRERLSAPVFVSRLRRTLALLVPYLLLTVLVLNSVSLTTASARVPDLQAEVAQALQNETPQQGVTAADSLTGTPSLASAYVVGNDSAFVFVGAESWTAQWGSVSNGSQVYSNELILIAFDIKTYDLLLHVDAYQSGHGWVSNQSLLLAPLAQTVIPVPFVNDPSWRGVVVLMDGTPFHCQIATPVSLLPPSVLNVGGLDILALAIISESIIAFASVIAVAKILQKKAKFAPKFSLLVWGHVALLSIAGAVIIDYQWIDAHFAGWSPLVYAIVVSPLIFLSSLSLFNESKKAEMLQRVAKPSGRILYRRWLLRFAVLADGRTVLIDERWRGWLARLCGQHVTIEKGDEFEPVSFEGLIEHRRSPTHSKGASGRIADRFKILNPQEDDAVLLWWTETGDPVKVKWPRLTIHKEKLRRKTTSLPDGTTAVHEEKYIGLSLPHYTAPEVELHRALEDYAAVEAVSARWANTRDLARVLSKVKTELYALKAAFSAQVDAEVESRLLAYYSLVGKTSADLTDEEAKDLATRGEPRATLAELLSEPRLRASNKPAPKTGTG